MKNRLSFYIFIGFFVCSAGLQGQSMDIPQDRLGDADYVSDHWDMSAPFHILEIDSSDGSTGGSSDGSSNRSNGQIDSHNDALGISMGGSSNGQGQLGGPALGGVSSGQGDSNSFFFSDLFVSEERKKKEKKEKELEMLKETMKERFKVSKKQIQKVLNDSKESKNLSDWPIT